MSSVDSADGAQKEEVLEPSFNRGGTEDASRAWLLGRDEGPVMIKCPVLKWARWQRSDLHVGVSERRPRSHPQVDAHTLFAMLSQRTGGVVAAVNLRSRATMVHVTKNLGLYGEYKHSEGLCGGAISWGGLSDTLGPRFPYPVS